MRIPADTHKISAFLTGFLVLESALAYLLLQPVIPLFYSLVNQENQLVPKLWVAVFPVAGIFIYIAHGILIKKLEKSELLAAQMLAWATVIVEILFVIALTRIFLIIL